MCGGFVEGFVEAGPAASDGVRVSVPDGVEVRDVETKARGDFFDSALMRAEEAGGLDGDLGTSGLIAFASGLLIAIGHDFDPVTVRRGFCRPDAGLFPLGAVP